MIADVLRGITVKEPWASAIVDGHKTTENRAGGFPCRYRGWVLIHSAQGWSERGRRDARILAAYGSNSDRYDRYPSKHRNARLYALRHVPAYHGTAPWPFLSGHVLGRARMDGAHDAAPGCCDDAWAETEYLRGDGQLQRRVVHIEFSHGERFVEPIAYRGSLGLWRPRPDLLAELGA